MGEMTCETVAALSAELALGVADVRERGAVPAHVEHCAGCRSRLRELADLADDLVALVPPAEPPSGFGSRVMGAHAPDQGTHTNGAWRLLPVRVAAAVVLGVLIAAGGWLLATMSAHRPGPSAADVTTAELSAHGHTVGEVIVTEGSDPWMSVKVDAPLAQTEVRCQIRRADGAVHTVGSFVIDAGYGYWATSISPGSPVRSAQLLNTNGRVLATAVLPAGDR